MKLEIEIVNENVRNYYINKSLQQYMTDSGIDLIFPEDIIIKPFESKYIPLGIKCKMFDNDDKEISYIVVGRSSISNTNLIMHCGEQLMNSNISELGINLVNINSNIETIKVGTRLVQIVAPDLLRPTIIYK
jgi:dUTPase